MNAEDFSPESPGTLVNVSAGNLGEGLAFLPDPLPPSLQLDADLWQTCERATFELGQLNGLGTRLPNPMLLVRLFVKKEALASTRIEGTRANFDQLSLFEAGEKNDAYEDDLREIVNYTLALGLAWERSDHFPPLTLAGVAGLHSILLSGVRGEQLGPGEYRDEPVLIGTAKDKIASARFVPSPPQEIKGLMQNLLEFLTVPHAMPTLVRLAVAHYQFETIHPFRDGNGRLGRLLIPIVLKEWGYLDRPLLYLSEYLEQHRDEYIDALYSVSVRGDWRTWINMFLTAVVSQSRDARMRAEQILDLRDEWRHIYQQRGRLRMLPIIDGLFEYGSMTYARAKEFSGLQPQGANALVKELVEDGILVERTGRVRNQIFTSPQLTQVSNGYAG